MGAGCPTDGIERELIQSTGDRFSRFLARREHENHRLALDMFARRAAAPLTAAATVRRRFNALAFTGGIGEHSATSRAAIVRRLGSLRVPQTLAAVDGENYRAAPETEGSAMSAGEDTGNLPRSPRAPNSHDSPTGW